MIHNTYLTDLANLMAGNSVTIPSHMAFSSSATDPSEGDSSLTGEIGSRVAFDETTVDNNAITFVATRRSNVPAAAGDTLTASGVADSSSGGSLSVSALLSSLLHTTSFDLEINHTVRHNRG